MNLSRLAPSLLLLAAAFPALHAQQIDESFWDNVQNPSNGCGSNPYFSFTFNNEVIADLDGDENTTNDQVRLNGNIFVSPFDLNICIGALGGNCQNAAELNYTMTAYAALEVSAEVGTNALDWKSDKLTLPMPPIPITGNITLYPLLDIYALIKGNAEAFMTTSLLQQIKITSDLVLIGNQTDTMIAQPEILTEFSTPALSGTSGATVTAVANVDVAFLVDFGAGPVVGPYVGTAFGTGLQVKPTEDPWWKLFAGYRVVAGQYNIFNGPSPLETLAGAKQLIDEAPGGLPGISGTETRWSNAYDLNDTVQRAYSMTLASSTSQGQYLISGSDGGNGSVLLELDEFGDPIWQKKYVDSGFQARFVQPVNAGGYIIGGAVTNTGPARLARIDASGNVLWSKQYDSVDTTEFHQVHEMPDGSFMAVGQEQAALTVFSSLVKVDANGNVLWAKKYRQGLFTDGIPTQDGGYIAAGELAAVESNLGQFKSAYVVKVDTNGQVQWAHEFGGTINDLATAITEAENGDILVAAQVTGACQAAYLGRFDSNGSLLWENTYATEEDGPNGSGNSQFDRITMISPTEGGFLICGYTEIGANTDPFYAKLDEDGDVVFWKSHHAAELDELYAIHPTDDGFITYGTTEGISSAADLWVVKTAFDGMMNYQDQYMATTWNDKPLQDDPSSNVSHADRMNDMGSDFVPVVTDETLTVTDINLTATTLNK